MARRIQRRWWAAVRRGGGGGRLVRLCQAWWCNTRIRMFKNALAIAAETRDLAPHHTGRQGGTRPPCGASRPWPPAPQRSSRRTIASAARRAAPRRSPATPRSRSSWDPMSTPWTSPPSRPTARRRPTSARDRASTRARASPRSARGSRAGSASTSRGRTARSTASSGTSSRTTCSPCARTACRR